VNQKWSKAAMRLVVFVAVIVPLLLGSQPANALFDGPRGLSDKDLKAIEKVFVYSSISDTPHIVKVGLTVFGNTVSQDNVSSWQLNQLLTSTALGELADNGIVTGEALPLTESASSGPGAIGPPGHIEFPNLLAYAKQHQVKTLLLFYQAGDSGGIAQSPPVGVGIYRSANTSCIFAKFIGAVVDVASGKRLAFIGVPPCSYDEAPTAQFKASLDQYPDEEKSAIEQAIKKQLRDTTIRIIVKLNLLREPRSRANTDKQ
jgi:hypothetical protein